LALRQFFSKRIFAKLEVKRLHSQALRVKWRFQPTQRAQRIYEFMNNYETTN